MMRKSMVVCTALVMFLTACGQPAQQNNGVAQNEAQQQSQESSAAQTFLDTLELTDVVTVKDDESGKIVLGTMDEAGQEAMDAYWRQVLNTDPAAQITDAADSSTLGFTEGDSKVELTLITDLKLYLKEHTDIPEADVKNQNFCYSIEKI